MNGFVSNFVGFDGRLNRQPFWISVLVLVVAGIVLNWLLLAVSGANGMVDIQALIAGGKTSEEISAMVLDLSRRSGWVSLIVFVILLYPAASISVKRRHDRGNSGLDVWIYMALALVLGLVQALGFGMSVMEVGGMTVPAPTPLLGVLGLVAGIFAIYLLVVLGFLKGTPGPNTYGPDPLQG